MIFFYVHISATNEHLKFFF